MRKPIDIAHAIQNQGNWLNDVPNHQLRALANAYIEIIETLNRKVESAEKTAAKVEQKVKNGGTHPSHLDYNQGVLDGIKSCVQAVKDTAGYEPSTKPT